MGSEALAPDLWILFLCSAAGFVLIMNLCAPREDRMWTPLIELGQRILDRVRLRCRKRRRARARKRRAWIEEVK
jgi:hypothetical protein